MKRVQRKSNPPAPPRSGAAPFLWGLHHLLCLVLFALWAQAAEGPRLRLLSPDGSGTVWLEAVTPSPGTYALERSTDLKTWTTIAQYELEAGKPTILADPTAKGRIAGFYRLRQEASVPSPNPVMAVLLAPTSVKVTWAYPAGQTIGFEIERYLAKTDEPDDEFIVESLGPDAREFLDQDVPPGTYYYLVFAELEDEYSELGVSSPITVGPPPPPCPDPPTNLTPTLKDGNDVALAWTPSPTAGATYVLKRFNAFSDQDADGGEDDGDADSESDDWEGDGDEEDPEPTPDWTKALAPGTTSYLDVDVPDGIYYYELVAVFEGCNSEPVYSDDVEVLPPPPPCEPPVLRAPCGGALVPPNSTVDWNEVPCAIAYELMITRDDGATRHITDVPTAYYKLEPPLRGQRSFTWKVRAVSADGPGDWSPECSFRTTEGPVGPVNPLHPACGALEASPRPDFQWSGNEEASVYDLEIYDAATWKLVKEVPGIAGTGYRAPEGEGLPGGKPYHWRVRGRNAASTGPWSDEGGVACTFTVRLSPPPAPRLRGPCGNIRVPVDIALDWDTVPGATSYDVLITRDDGETRGVISGITTAYYKVDPPLRAERGFTWIVRAVNAAGPGDWSDDCQFRTRKAPVLLNPECGAPETSTRPEFRWSSVDAAEVYDLKIVDPVGWREVKSVRGIQGTSYRAPEGDGLQRGKTYWWHVRGRNSDHEGPWGPGCPFTVRR